LCGDIVDYETDLEYESITALGDIEKEVAKLYTKDELDEAVKAAKAYQELSICYRIGKRPTEKLFEQLEKANKYLKELEDG
jgi:hypothetical protein